MTSVAIRSAQIGALLFALGYAGAAHADQAPQGQQVLAFRNELPGDYQLERVRLVVDGALRYDAPRPFDVVLAPNARHVVTIVADYRLRDPVFTYVNGMRVQVRSTHELTPLPGRNAVVTAVAAPTGGVTTPVERRAAIAWEERLR